MAQSSCMAQSWNKYTRNSQLMPNRRGRGCWQAAPNTSPSRLAQRYEAPAYSYSSYLWKYSWNREKSCWWRHGQPWPGIPSVVVHNLGIASKGVIRVQYWQVLHGRSFRGGGRRWRYKITWRQAITEFIRRVCAQWIKLFWQMRWDYLDPWLSKC